MSDTTSDMQKSKDVYKKMISILGSYGERTIDVNANDGMGRQNPLDILMTSLIAMPCMHQENGDSLDNYKISTESKTLLMDLQRKLEGSAKVVENILGGSLEAEAEDKAREQ